MTARLPLVLALLVLASPVLAEDEAPRDLVPPDANDATATAPADPAVAREPASEEEIARIAARIDALLEASWKENGLNAAEPVDDATFLRRASLDVAGRIPTVAEVRAFVAGDSPDKRRRLVERLLSGRGYVNHFTRLWTDVLLPEGETDQQARFMLPGFEMWVYDRLDRNTPYDEFVRELLTVAVDGSQNVYSYQQGTLTPLAFYQAKETKPENLAAATTRAFLGIRLECAQCHDHPFDTWEREQFWQTAAFFSGIQRNNRGRGLFTSLQELFTQRSIQIPDSLQVVSATYLDGTQPVYVSTPRAALADWITARDNPWFARAAVNRVWAQFFGRGIVDPVDDFTAAHPPSHPELLDELAADFVAHDFDLRHLIRVITATRAYQLASRAPGASPNDLELFQRMAVKGLTAEQLYDSLATAIGHHDPNAATRSPFANYNDERSRFLETFRDASATPTTRQATILQALTMMNGEFVTQGTNPEPNRGRLLSALVAYPFDTPRDRLDTLHYATLGRPATGTEATRLLEYVESKPEAERPSAYANVFWALLNGSEFATNH
jgi:hypothetical protein